MTEDLLDHWVKLISPFFPTHAWIVTRYSGDNHIIEIDWKLNDDPRRPHRRSRKIQITISSGAIVDYLDKNKEDRRLFEISLRKLIHERFNHSHSVQQIDTGSSQSMDRMLVTKDMINPL